MKTYNCKIQIGGSDQWGNITTGLDLIRKTQGEGRQSIWFNDSACDESLMVRNSVKQKVALFGLMQKKQLRMSSTNSGLTQPTKML